MNYPKSIKNLIEKFSKLPAVGPKTAERYVFYLLKQSPETLKEFGENLKNLKENTLFCESCHGLSETTPCEICQDNNRNSELLCIVSNTQDLISLESINQFEGKYFVLNGLINTIENIHPQDLNIKNLIKKIKKENIKEVIIALSPTIEGETTSLYLHKLLKTYNIKTTQLARGLSTGANLEYIDQNTLANAFKNRSEIK